jgi:hypothetical protein
MGLRNLCGFGCAVFGPDSDWRRCQGLCFHISTYSVLPFALHVNKNLASVLTFAVQYNHEAKGSGSTNPLNIPRKKGIRHGCVTGWNLAIFLGPRAFAPYGNP